MVALLLGRRKILAAVLADVAGMPGSALPAEHWQAYADAHLPALLSWGAFDRDGPGEAIELSLVLALANPSVTSRSMALLEEIFAPAAYEDTWVESITPLMLARLIGRMSLPLPASRGQTFESEWVRHGEWILTSC